MIKNMLRLCQHKDIPIDHDFEGLFPAGQYLVLKIDHSKTYAHIECTTGWKIGPANFIVKALNNLYPENEAHSGWRVGYVVRRGKVILLNQEN